MVVLLQGNWTKYLTRASLASQMSLRPYNPTKVIAKVTAPILIIAGERVQPERCSLLAGTGASTGRPIQ